MTSELDRAEHEVPRTHGNAEPVVQTAARRDPRGRKYYWNNSIFTLGLVIGISVGDTTLGTTVANLGMTDVRFPKPVFHGDTIRATTTVIATRRSRSRTDAGIVEFEHEGLNQRGETVAICRRAALMKTRPA